MKEKPFKGEKPAFILILDLRVDVFAEVISRVSVQYHEECVARCNPFQPQRTTTPASRHSKIAAPSWLRKIRETLN